MRNVAKNFLFLILSLVPLSPCIASEWYQNLKVGEVYSWRFFGEDRGTQANFFFEPTFEYNSEIDIFVQGKFVWDFVYLDNNRFQKSAEDAYLFDSRLGEFYFRKQINNWDLTFGWQKIVWGVADEIIVVDRLNSFDYREFVLTPLETQRDPSLLLSLRGSIFESLEVELVVLPRHEPNKLALPSSEFFIQGIEEVFGLPISPIDTPKQNLSNSEIGLRLGSTVGYSDWALYAYYGREKNIHYELSGSFSDQPEQLSLQGYYPRLSLLGASLSSTLGKWVVRQELALTPHKYFMTDQGQVLATKQAMALLGVDYLWKNWLFSVQGKDQWNESIDQTLLSPFEPSAFTVFAEGNLMGDSLNIRASATRVPEENGGEWWQLRLRYSPRSAWLFEVTIDELKGANNNIFGRFKDKDRIKFEVNYQIQ